MATIQIRNLTFTYPLATGPALRDVSLRVAPSSFTVLCGKSGCGKSTLLRQLKKNLIPYGVRQGQVLYNGQEVSELPDRYSVTEIGFVQQNPDNQLVTDKVWHELAFGLESLGLDNQSIRRRVAEMASFFDMQAWFRKGVHELSGGQKQLLNLASVMVMQPKVLILDEPTSQLDPIAAEEFLKTVYKINRDLGTTVIISEHRLEDLFPMADRVVVMDGGRIIANDEPRKIAGFLAGSGASAAGEEPAKGDGLTAGEEPAKDHGLAAGEEPAKDHGMATGEEPAKDHGLAAGSLDGMHDEAGEAETDRRHPMFYGLPAVMKIYAGSKAAVRERAAGQQWTDRSPLTIREGRLWLEDLLGAPTERPMEEPARGKVPRTVAPAEMPLEENQIISMKDVWFQYSRSSGEVLRGLDLTVKKGELFCLLGGNGVGKSTTLKAVAGLIRPQRGVITVDGMKVCKENQKQLMGKTLAMVPQNPQALFTEITVEEELMEALYFEKMQDREKAEQVSNMLKTMEISHLRKSHPYDLSGGEQQRLALGKILLLQPKILLLDEPTKGLDPFFKITLAGIFDKLKAQGVTLFMVSHDIEFCASYGDRCAMFFDGSVVSAGEPKAFFSGNSFYTTTANRIVRQWNDQLITWEEVSRWVEQATTR